MGGIKDIPDLRERKSAVKSAVSSAFSRFGSRVHTACSRHKPRFGRRSTAESTSLHGDGVTVQTGNSDRSSVIMVKPTYVPGPGYSPGDPPLQPFVLEWPDEGVSVMGWAKGPVRGAHLDLSERSNLFGLSNAGGAETPFSQYDAPLTNSGDHNYASEFENSAYGYGVPTNIPSETASWMDYLRPSTYLREFESCVESAWTLGTDLASGAASLVFRAIWGETGTSEKSGPQSRWTAARTVFSRDVEPSVCTLDSSRPSSNGNSMSSMSGLPGTVGSTDTIN